MDEDVYLDLPSNASMSLFPDNRLSTFRVRLPFLHEFEDDKYYIALTEIKYTKSWFNVHSGHYVSPTLTHEAPLPDILKPHQKTQVQPGFYHSPQELIDHINDLMTNWRSGQVVAAPEFEILGNQKLSLKSPGRINYDGNAIDFSVKTDKHLDEILGISEDRPAHLNQGMSALYVYCDLVTNQVVGDHFAPLLRSIGVPTDARFGDDIVEIFETPYYLKLAKSQFQDVTIYLRNDQNQSPSFTFGRTIVTLHIKKL